MQLLLLALVVMFFFLSRKPAKAAPQTSSIFPPSETAQQYIASIVAAVRDSAKIVNFGSSQGYDYGRGTGRQGQNGPSADPGENPAITPALSKMRFNSANRIIGAPKTISSASRITTQAKVSRGPVVDRRAKIQGSATLPPFPFARRSSVDVINSLRN